MYCIIITGIPASGKSVLAGFLSEKLNLPAISKDKIKELLYDDVGFRSREEKVKLGIASMNIMYHMAEQLMSCGQAFMSGITARGMDTFTLNGPQITLDTTDFSGIDHQDLLRKIKALQEKMIE